MYVIINNIHLDLCSTSGSVAPQVIRDLNECIMTMNDLGAMTLEVNSQFIKRKLSQLTA